jgi:hypothetical protein
MSDAEELQPPELKQVAVVNQDSLRAVLREYAIDSRSGDTASYRETAEMSIEQLVETSFAHMWAKFEAAGLVVKLQSIVDDGTAVPGELDEAMNQEFVAIRPGRDVLLASEDIAAGQLCVLDLGLQIRVATDEEVAAAKNEIAEGEDLQEEVGLRDAPEAEEAVSGDMPQFDAPTPKIGDMPNPVDTESRTAEPELTPETTTLSSPDVLALFGLT